MKENTVMKPRVEYRFRWHAFSYVDLRLAPDMSQDTINRLKSHLLSGKEATSFQVDFIDNGEQKCWVLLIGTTNNRTTMKRVREFFNDRQIEWMEEYQYGHKGDPDYRVRNPFDSKPEAGE